MLNFQIEQLKRTPQRPESVWQGGLFRTYSWITGEGPKPFRPWVALWVSATDHKIGPPSLFRPEEYDSARAVDSLLQFIRDPDFGGYRPGRIEVCDPALAEHLRTFLYEAGIDVVCKDSLPLVDGILTDMAETALGHPLPPGVLSGKGVTIERVSRFADAAKVFYLAAPWNHLTDEDLIHIESPKPPPGLRYTTVLGAGGSAFGLGFFGSANECWSMRRAADPAQWLANRKRGVWSVTFGDITELPFDDVDLWEEHHLAVADETGYPYAVCYNRRKDVTRPDARTLAFLEGLLLALARSTEEQMDAGRWSVMVETADGPAEFTLTLPDILDPPNHKELMDRGFMPDRRAFEQMHAQMQRFLADKEFSTIEEVNAALAQEFMGEIPDPGRFPPRDALEQAQNLCYEAFGSIGRRRVQLARQALAICPDCADAYVLLAEHTSEAGKAAELYAQGVAAGERALGQERFERDAGDFWHIIDTRPYMRARFGLAQCLEHLGRTDEAVDHYRALLELNPSDNQGVRDLYIPLLLRLGRDAEAAQFMRDFGDEPTANWMYARALLAYRLSGDSAAARAELKRALKTNPHVARYLLAGEEPDVMPDSYSLGSHEEALICADTLQAAFENTPGALDWLGARSSTLMESASRRNKRPRKRNDRDKRRKERKKQRRR